VRVHKFKERARRGGRAALARDGTTRAATFDCGRARAVSADKSSSLALLTAGCILPMGLNLTGQPSCHSTKSAPARPILGERRLFAPAIRTARMAPIQARPARAPTAERRTRPRRRPRPRYARVDWPVLPP